MKAIVWRTGKIEFVQRCPTGALLITTAPARKLRPVVEVVARHAYDGKTLLVPGVPEAEDELAAYSAVRAFIDQVNRRLADQVVAA